MLNLTTNMAEYTWNIASVSGSLRSRQGNTLTFISRAVWAVYPLPPSQNATKGATSVLSTATCRDVTLTGKEPPSTKLTASTTPTQSKTKEEWSASTENDEEAETSTTGEDSSKTDSTDKSETTDKETTTTTTDEETSKTDSADESKTTDEETTTTNTDEEPSKTDSSDTSAESETSRSFENKRISLLLPTTNQKTSALPKITKSLISTTAKSSTTSSSKTTSTSSTGTHSASSTFSHTSTIGGNATTSPTTSQTSSTTTTLHTTATLHTSAEASKSSDDESSMPTSFRTFNPDSTVPTGNTSGENVKRTVDGKASETISSLSASLATDSRTSPASNNLTETSEELSSTSVIGGPNLFASERRWRRRQHLH